MDGKKIIFVAVITVVVVVAMLNVNSIRTKLLGLPAKA